MSDNRSGSTLASPIGTSTAGKTYEEVGFVRGDVSKNDCIVHSRKATSRADGVMGESIDSAAESADSGSTEFGDSAETDGTMGTMLAPNPAASIWLPKSALQSEYSCCDP